MSNSDFSDFSDLSFPSKFKQRKPSKREMEDMFEEIVKYIRKKGCPVTVHKNLSKINGSNGYFCSDPKPHIKAAIKDKGWDKAIQLIVHEFCHYWQWKDKFIGHKDDQGNIIYSRILEGEKITPKQREKASVLVRLSEYDCEIRTADLLKKWNITSIYPIHVHIKSANTYNRHIAWSVGSEKNEGSGVFLYTYDKLANKLWGTKKFSRFWDPKTSGGRKKIFDPISNKHKAVFDAALQRINKKTAARRR